MKKKDHPIRVKIVGENFLHNHPKMERVADLNSDHVIVDREDWECVIRFFNNNPTFVQYLCKE